MRDPNHASYLRGDKLFKEEKFVDAAAFFKIAIKEWPEDWQAIGALGNCFSEMKKHRKAAQQFRSAIGSAAVDELPNLYFNQGNSLFDQGKYEEAIQPYRQAPLGHHIARKVAKNIALAEKRFGNER